MKTNRASRQGVQDQLRTLIRQAREVVKGMGHEAFNRRPAEDEWSVGECLEHLNETARLYLPEFSEAIETAREDGLLSPPGTSGRTVLGRLVTWTQEPPARFRSRTFPALEPERGQDPEAVLEEFEALHEELIVRINEAADLDRKKIRMRSLLNPRLKLSLDDWFHFLAAHGRRHVWQARQAREQVSTLDRGPDAES